MKSKHRSVQLLRFLHTAQAVSALQYAMVVGIIAIAVGVALFVLGGDIETAIGAIGDRVEVVQTDLIVVQ